MMDIRKEKKEKRKKGKKEKKKKRNRKNIKQKKKGPPCNSPHLFNKQTYFRMV